jgi:hypothetical protein
MDKDDQITLKPNNADGQKEASKGKEITLMDKTKEASERKNNNPLDMQLDHG